MMPGMMVLTPFRSLVLGVWLLASAGVANAETSRQGFYAGIELGFANAADAGSVLSGVNHPTKCDQLLKDSGKNHNVVPLSDPDCTDTTPQRLTTNSFFSVSNSWAAWITR